MVKVLHDEDIQRDVLTGKKLPSSAMAHKAMPMHKICVTAVMKL